MAKAFKAKTDVANVDVEKPKPKRNYRCQFPGCSNTGTISLTTTGPAPGEDDFRKWHCREHWRKTS
ncbi:MAG: hypothetical protein KGJ13_09955 [Patescibacteria group bacterium]|nr:hypothetical protein [Patescibacteria group bacterium]